MSKPIICEKCGEEDKSKIELHHIVPKCMGGTDKDGRKYLCTKCHDIWHHMIPYYLIKFIPQEKRIEAKEYIKNVCLWYIKKGKR